MKQNKVETTNENDLPPMKKNGYAVQSPRKKHDRYDFNRVTYITS